MKQFSWSVFPVHNRRADYIFLPISHGAEVPSAIKISQDVDDFHYKTKNMTGGNPRNKIHQWVLKAKYMFCVSKHHCRQTFRGARAGMHLQIACFW